MQRGERSHEKVSGERSRSHRQNAGASNRPDLHCITCGQACSKESSLLLTECNRIFCSRCAEPDNRGRVVCRPCRSRCPAREIDMGNPPSQLRMLLQSPKDLLITFSKVNEMQTRLRKLDVQRLERRMERISSKEREVDEEISRLVFLNRKADRFLNKLQYLTMGSQELTPKFRSTLTTISKIDMNSGLDNFLSNLSDTSDSVEETEDRGNEKTPREAQRVRGRSEPGRNTEQQKNERLTEKHLPHSKHSAEVRQRTSSAPPNVFVTPMTDAAAMRQRPIPGAPKRALDDFSPSTSEAASYGTPNINRAQRSSSDSGQINSFGMPPPPKMRAGPMIPARRSSHLNDSVYNKHYNEARDRELAYDQRARFRR